MGISIRKVISFFFWFLDALFKDSISITSILLRTFWPIGNTDVFYGWLLRFFTDVRESESRPDRQNHITKVATLLFSMTSVVKFWVNWEQRYAQKSIVIFFWLLLTFKWVVKNWTWCLKTKCFKKLKLSIYIEY